MRTYRILRSTRTKRGSRRTIVAAGIESFAAADTQRDRLQEAERLAHPGQSSWTYDIFIVEPEEVAA